MGTISMRWLTKYTVVPRAAASASIGVPARMKWPTCGGERCLDQRRPEGSVQARVERGKERGGEEKPRGLRGQCKQVERGKA